MHQKVQRDAKGRFVRGNTVALGNKGNRLAKYGNKNAVKYGLHSRMLFSQRIIGDDLILIAYHKGIAVRFFKGEWINHGDSFTILGDKAICAQKLLGWSMLSVKVPLEYDISINTFKDFQDSVLIKPRDNTFMSILQTIYRLPS